jgi:hypothetical protein
MLIWLASQSALNGMLLKAIEEDEEGILTTTNSLFGISL